MLHTRSPVAQYSSLRTVVFLVVAGVFTSGGWLRGASAGSLKYTHGPLVSALSGRSAGGGGGEAVSAGGEAASGGSGSSGGSGTSGASVSATTALDAGPAESGGEVLVPKAFPMGAQEPTCEQLRAMWIFSKRQSRAAEITNEIPTYRDPFAYNVWEPYYSTTRSMGSVRMVPRFGERARSPVFGRVVSREPLLPQRLALGHRQRHLGEVGPGRIYGAESKPVTSIASQRRPTQYRYVGGSSAPLNGVAVSSPNSVAVQGSFQKLKELIWTERAKELTQQRRAEEMAARAAVLKEIANGQNVLSSYKHSHKSESPLMDENRSPDRDGYRLLNDGRVSIASAQQAPQPAAAGASATAGGGTSAFRLSPNPNPNRSHNRNGNGNHNHNGNRAKSLPPSNRSYSNKGHGGAHKSSIFSGVPSNSGRAGRLLLPSMIASSYSNEDSRERERERERETRERDRDRERSSLGGIPKAYPMRPSHFRERNRSIFKQTSPSDFFQRDIRVGGLAVADMDVDAQNRILDTILENLSRHSQQEYSRLLAAAAADAAKPDSESDVLVRDLELADSGDVDGDFDGDFDVGERGAPRGEGLGEDDRNRLAVDASYVDEGSDLNPELAAELLDYMSFY